MFFLCLQLPILTSGFIYNEVMEKVKTMQRNPMTTIKNFWVKMI